jgi:hypothetical protein
MQADCGQQRAPSIPDLMVAATAELAGLTVLHVGKDFELIAPTSWGRGRSRPRVRRRSGPCCGSSGGKRRRDPHGHGSLRPSFSTSSVSAPTTRLPRLTLDSLEGIPGGACWSGR